MFKNIILQRLDNVVNSSLISNLTKINDICDILYPYVSAVIDNVDAYEESKTSNIYKCIGQHVEKCKPQFIKMNLNDSMCFSIYMNVYH
jgi:hypothetical protein